jgi:hypothetical protein
LYDKFAKEGLGVRHGGEGDENLYIGIGAGDLPEDRTIRETRLDIQAKLKKILNVDVEVDWIQKVYYS